MKKISNAYYVSKGRCHRLLLLVPALLLSACATVEPWVKPYERENLADPIMAFGRHPIALAHSSKVRDTREAAKGADGSGGGGCGCN
ncbi:DUF4266 domain-containing protein [Arsukibacterium sp.]|uniref:DUF4266 domain-containing protein n=1 Tax=Arsukibacterium sp. TaxID=1977258 RepID=UPI002FDA0685